MKGITLGRDDAVVGMVVVKRTAALLVVTEKGMGKRTPVDEYRVQGRGGKGIITQDVTPKTGAVVSVLEVVPEDEVMLITKGGTAIRCPVGEIREIGRNTQGVRCINLDGDDRVTAVARVVSEEKDGVAGGEDVAPAGAGGDEAEEG